MDTDTPRCEVVIVKNTFLDVAIVEGTFSPARRRRYSTLPHSFRLSPKRLQLPNEFNDEDDFIANCYNSSVGKGTCETLTEVSTEATSEPPSVDSDTEPMCDECALLTPFIPQVLVTFVEDAVVVPKEEQHQEAGQYLAQSLMPSHRKAALAPCEVAQYRQVFEYVDKDGNGFITPDELGNVLCAFVQEATASELEDLVSSVDLAGNGKIDFAEFLMWVSRRSQCEADELREAFQIFDTNHDGLIDASELRLTLAALGETITCSQASAAIFAFDNDHDGHIDYREFVEMMSVDCLGEFIQIVSDQRP